LSLICSTVSIATSLWSRAGQARNEDIEMGWIVGENEVQGLFLKAENIINKVAEY